MGAEASFRKVGSFDDLALKVQKKRKERTLQNEGNHGKEKNSLSAHCSSSSFILWEPLEPSFIGEAQKNGPTRKCKGWFFQLSVGDGDVSIGQPSPTLERLRLGLEISPAMTNPGVGFAHKIPGKNRKLALKHVAVP